ncbi:MAG: hypothetical protein LBS79_09695, partial [Tannerella sp.]|nr:hypothetical protein [Tannerella sp.]
YLLPITLYIIAVPVLWICFPNFLGNRISINSSMKVCNFPDEARLWNLKNLFLKSAKTSSFEPRQEGVSRQKMAQIKRNTSEWQT